MSGPVLQMLGARYNIEPFFFSSSLNWIPSRYEEEVRPKEGDHITITLTFLKSLEDSRGRRNNDSTPSLPGSVSSTIGSAERTILVEQMIDTQAPLRLRSSRRLLVLDLLSVHLIRKANGSTIISYHHEMDDHKTTTAKYLQERIRFAGQSVYWQSIFQKSSDPTFVLVVFLWHAMYAWDEALESLYKHICWLETRVINTSDMILTQELHIIRAHQLHYSSLLEDFKKTVEFVRTTRNPAMDALEESERKYSTDLMDRECHYLLSEIERLEMGRRMQDKRLKNVMNLVFSSVNIGDSKRMQQMTEAAVRDSAAMKQIAYLTMIFLPASFVAAVFGMNVKTFAPETAGTLPHYVGAAISLTILTIWIIVAFQSRYIFAEGTSIWVRLAWPFLLFGKLVKRKENDDNLLGTGTKKGIYP
ncbi:hypothetical protein BDZ94DRAFT_1249633 [Collybia nuda]|uniref:Uncharacterized protein n=1 Tax=Collybia nuda TaxID=64659 RepID=A0A9P5YFY2_9AGAR|nr:hypothetical protein BDZ94DRAFT_1249633 [Collybia nuda]